MPTASVGVRPKGGEVKAVAERSPTEGGACAPPRAEHGREAGEHDEERGRRRRPPAKRQAAGVIFCMERSGKAKGMTAAQCLATSGARINTSSGGPEPLIEW